MRETCVWIILRKRSDPWAQPGERYRSICGETATHDSGTGPLCSKHASYTTAPNPKRKPETSSHGS